MNTKVTELKSRLAEVYDLNMIGALLNWDSSTYMPLDGAPARGRQMGLIARIGHEKMTDPAIGRLLDELHAYEESLPYDSDEASLIRVARREYERAIRVPAAFMAKLQEHIAETFDVWTRARPANDFKRVQGMLEKTVDLSRQLASYFPGYQHIIDPLISYSDYGMKAADIRAIFADLRNQLLPLIKTITSQDDVDDGFLHQPYSTEKQLAFGLNVIKLYGYDFNRGRQDLTHHPYTTKFSLSDVRITTRVKENDLCEALFGTLHESGHAIYEQGINLAYEGTPLASGASSGVHESQSRTWENLIGRSRGFWEFFYPKLKEIFPTQLSSISVDRYYRAINKVQRSLIRTDADEVTYNLHPIIRFDLELRMLEGTLEVRDLPQAWDERYANDIGITPPNDRDGVLQDVHWYSGIIGGAFQGYTLGNIMSAQFYAEAVKAHPEINEQIASGEFTTLSAWLKQAIYQHGAKFTADELLHRVTGQGLSIEPYVTYLKNKYSSIYKLG